MQAQKLSQEEYLKWLGLYGEFFRLLSDFSKQPIDNDMLILMGEDDYIFLRSAKNFARNREKSYLKIIPKVGHICNIEKPNEVNQSIMDFLHS